MIGSQRLLIDHQSAKVEGLGVGVGALAFVQRCEVVEAVGGIGVLEPQRHLPDRQGAKMERLGFGVDTMTLVQLCQVVEACGDRGMIGPVVSLHPGQLLLLQRNCRLKSSLLIERHDLLPPRPHLRRHLPSPLPRLRHQPRISCRHPPSLYLRHKPQQQPRNDQQSRSQSSKRMTRADGK